MPYLADHKLAELISPEACVVAAREMSADVLDAYLGNVRRNTPVDTSEHKGRHDRPRGTARASLRKSRPRREGDVVTGRVYTEDPIFEFIEWDTAAHNIPNAFGYGPNFGLSGRFEGKFHPGTRGQHPFAIGAAITESEFEQHARPALERWKRDVTRPGVSSVDRRAR